LDIYGLMVAVPPRAKLIFFLVWSERHTPLLVALRVLVLTHPQLRAVLLLAKVVLATRCMGDPQSHIIGQRYEGPLNFEVGHGVTDCTTLLPWRSPTLFIKLGILDQLSNPFWLPRFRIILVSHFLYPKTTGVVRCGESFTIKRCRCSNVTNLGTMRPYYTTRATIGLSVDYILHRPPSSLTTLRTSQAIHSPSV